MKLSIIIPALNEADSLGQTLKSIDSHSAEIIVVDGGSTDGTVQTARECGSNVLTSHRGRGIQQHTGALQAQGDTLVFLHADTQLPAGYEQLIKNAMVDLNVLFGAFTLAIHPRSTALNLIAFVANLRSKLLKLPYGDQAIFVRRSAYFQVGGFRDWPIMEDVDLVRRLNRAGDFQLARGSVQTSARRWKQKNVLLTTLKNWSRMVRFCLGTSPHSLVGDYPDVR
jgi:rSAM/selenodomain-associated transferase 2